MKVRQTRSAAVLHLAIATSCVVPWTSGTEIIFINYNHSCVVNPWSIFTHYLDFGNRFQLGCHLEIIWPWLPSIYLRSPWQMLLEFYNCQWKKLSFSHILRGFEGGMMSRIFMITTFENLSVRERGLSRLSLAKSRSGKCRPSQQSSHLNHEVDTIN